MWHVIGKIYWLLLIDYFSSGNRWKYYLLSLLRWMEVILKIISANVCQERGTVLKYAYVSVCARGMELDLVYLSQSAWEWEGEGTWLHRCLTVINIVVVKSAVAGVRAKASLNTFLCNLRKSYLNSQKVVFSLQNGSIIKFSSYNFWKFKWDNSFNEISMVFKLWLVVIININIFKHYILFISRLSLR